MNRRDFIKQIYRGKTLGRILFNGAVSNKCMELEGKVFDIAGGNSPSYLKFIPKKIELVSADVLHGGINVDMNRPLPFKDEEFDGVLFFNAIYIAENPLFTMQEARRVLKKGGHLYLSSPFIANEMPEPHDYVRFTYEGLGGLFEEAGFSSIKIERLGDRFSVVAHILHPFFIFNTMRLCVYTTAILIDRLIPKKLRERHPLPISYFCILKK